LMTLIAFVISIFWVFAASRWEQTMLDPEEAAKIQLLRRQLSYKRD
jgi:hypothetical protein